MRAITLLSSLLPWVWACGPNVQTDRDGNPAPAGVDAPVAAVDGPSWPDAGPPPVTAKVYAHSAGELYEVDPDTLAISLVGPFTWSNGADQMTDIALDKDGAMVGISFSYVYAIDKTTAACTRLAALDRSFNGLSFVPAEEIEPTGGEEVLVAAALDGGWLYRLDPQTGASTPIGQYGNGYFSSGDLVSVSGFGTVATAKLGVDPVDVLVRVDASTGQATPIGSTGVQDIWGLGFWGGKIHGFTDNQQFVLIDVTTGAATVQPTSTAVQWWGAGVTTSAPIVQ